jgi:hypothetical protein
VAERSGLVEDGATSGGGTIDTLAADHGTDLVIYVRDGDQLWEYSLVGGPWMPDRLSADPRPDSGMSGSLLATHQRSS